MSYWLNYSVISEKSESEVIYTMNTPIMYFKEEDSKNENAKSHGIAWNDNYSLDNERLDTQHKQLFEFVSELVGACIDGSSTGKLSATLDFLVNYAVRHFADEEALQLEYNFPYYESHKKMHEDFKVTVTGLVERFQNSASPTELNNDINKIVVRWLVNHIQREDRKIGDHIRKVEGAAVGY